MKYRTLFDSHWYKEEETKAKFPPYCPAEMYAGRVA